MPSELTPLGQDQTTVDVNQCVEKALRQIEWPVQVALEKHLSDGIPPLPLYSFDIVVQNLLQNGLDAMPEGGQLTVRTAMVLDPTQSKGYLQLSISDTGRGIPPDVQKRMFELNFTTKVEKGKGLGLGLWWVRNFVRRSRGDITIRSEPGSGTEAIVKIPVNRPASAAQAVAAD
jgi:signal transduction histidine kinase